jgi:ribose 5-phosphate isomerase B
MDSSVIVIASDHNGNDSRTHLRSFLLKNGYRVVDIGPVGWKKVDYQEYAFQVAHAVQHDPQLRGILICGTGIGMSIAANRLDGVRAALVYDVECAKKTRDHNNSNVLVLGSWKNTPEEMEDIVMAWLNQEWGAGRHVVRVKQLDQSFYRHELVLVPGIFDILMPGHVELLRYAKKIGVVIVALNSDASAERVKGKKPFQPAEWRKKVIESLGGVDEVIINDSDDVGDLIGKLGVKYVVKGDNFDETTVRKNDKVPSSVEVVLFPIMKEYKVD